MSFGKIFGSMYEGSMIGAGSTVFAVWGYVIAKAYKSRVEINPELLAHLLGEPVAEIEKALEYLMAPDPRSRHSEHEGKRLIKESPMGYYIPTWAHYHRTMKLAERREYNRQKQAEYRRRDKALESPEPDSSDDIPPDQDFAEASDTGGEA